MIKSLLIFLLFFSSARLDASIPQDLLKYVDNELPSIIRHMPSTFSKQQVKLTLERATELLIEKFKKSVDMLESFNRSELFDYLVEKNRFDNEKIKEIDLILEKFSGVRVKDLISINFRGQKIPLKIILYTATFDILLNGIPIKSDSKENCLELNIDLKEKAAHLIWLGVAETACPIGSAQPGTFLLDLTESIAQVLKLEEITLTDASTVMCDKNQEEINLRILKIFQTGKSWYERKGYLPKIEAEASKYRSQIEEFVNYKISEIQKELAAITKHDIENIVQEVGKWKDSREKKEILLYCQKFFTDRAFFDHEVSLFKLKNQSEFFSDFMSWLYNVNCEKYTIIYNLIFPNFRQKTHYKKPKSDKKLSINEDFPSNPELVKRLSYKSDP